MGTVVRYERSWRTPREVSHALRWRGVRRPDTYIPISVSGRTVPYHRSFNILYYFLFSWKFGEDFLKRGTLSSAGVFAPSSTPISCLINIDSAALGRQFSAPMGRALFAFKTIVASSSNIVRSLLCHRVAIFWFIQKIVPCFHLCFPLGFFIEGGPKCASLNQP